MSPGCRLSVVIPAFGSEAHIGPTLLQLRSQTFSDFEIIVVNDGSKDGTSATVRRIMDEDPRIRLFEQPNRGMAAARNHGIAVSHGEVLAFLDDDDLWSPRKLELQLARLDAVPEAAVVSCFSGLVDPDRRLLGWRFGGSTEGDVYREMLECDAVSGGSVAIVRRGPLEEVGGFDESLLYRADWDLWIRLARRHPFAFVPRTLVGYTRRVGSVSRGSERMIEEGRRVLAKARRDDPSIDERAARAYEARDLFGVACLCLVDAQLSAARRYLGRALRAAPALILREPRRWGVILMLALASSLPGTLYRQALAAMSRGAFQLRPGEPFESLHRRG